jgi:PEP-CTERM motif
MKKIIPIMITVLGTATLASAQTVYEETFTPQGSAITASGWSVSTPDANWYSGTFAYGIVSSATSLPINGQNPLYIGAGSATGINGEVGMFYTTSGSGGFSSINPASYSSLNLNIFANLQGGGGNTAAYFAVQVGGSWYASSIGLTPPVSSDLIYDPETLAFNPAAANWNNLTVTPTLVTIGGQAAGDLSGLITGVGLVHVINNPANSYASWNYADFSVTAVPAPEPGSLALMGAGLGLIALCRRARPAR